MRIDPEKKYIIQAIIMNIVLVFFIGLVVLFACLNYAVLSIGIAFLSVFVLAYAILFLFRINWFHIDEEKIVAKNLFGTIKIVKWNKVQKIELRDLEYLSSKGHIYITDGYVFLTNQKEKDYSMIWNRAESPLRIQANDAVKGIIEKNFKLSIVDKRKEKIRLFKIDVKKNYTVGISKEHIYSWIVSEKKLKWSDIHKIELRYLIDINISGGKKSILAYVLFSKNEAEKDNDLLINQQGIAMRVPFTNEIARIISENYDGIITNFK